MRVAARTSELAVAPTEVDVRRRDVERAAEAQFAALSATEAAIDAAERAEAEKKSTATEVEVAERAIDEERTSRPPAEARATR